MNWLLVRLLVLTVAGTPVKGVWVEVEGMFKTEFYEEQVTDSRGVFVVQVEPGTHRVTLTKDRMQSVDTEFTANTNADAFMFRMEPTR